MKTDMIPFVGAATALVTPMNDDLSIDFDSLGKIIEFQINSDINALLILGTTGEASTLNDDEKHEIIDFAVSKVGGRIPLIVGTGSNDTRHAVEMSRYATSAGADAVLVVTPYYNKTTDEGLVRHFYSIADNSGCPVILYNIPSRTGMKISLPVYEKLAQHEKIIGVKEASGDVSAVGDIIAKLGDRFSVYSGNDSETVPITALGGRGVFSVLSNIMPREVAVMCDLLKHGSTAEAARISHRLLPLTKALFSEVNPISVKEACSIIGLCNSVTRPPLCEMSQNNRELLIKEMKNQGLT